ncbi:MAG: hypothetical protein M1827_005576 [Pycnora praestabilis]|nr:MAG: hypothetical protein M1827_005576 [Pycnora praestabilis]
MPSTTKDLVDEPPTSINPYEVLNVSKTATSDEIKSAYRKAALKHHPDKAQPSSKDAAHTKFQEIAFAYAILSEPRRRSRYDISGRTEESLADDDSDFNWADFYREQWADAITSDALEKFKTEYKHSEEEEKDLITAYGKCKGDMDMVFEEVMLSNPLEDEDRFRAILDKAIEEGHVEPYKKYTSESAGKRKKRVIRAKKEEAEAMELAEELGVKDKLFGNGNAKSKGQGGKKSKKEESEDALAALIMQRQKGRAETFLDDLEAKYAGGSNSDKRGRKRNADDEPPEEAFEKTKLKLKKGKANQIGGDKDRAEDVSKTAINDIRRSKRAKS